MKHLWTPREFAKKLKAQFPEVEHVAVFDPLIDEDGIPDPGLVSVLLPPGLKKREVREWINENSDKLESDFEIEVI